MSVHYFDPSAWIKRHFQEAGSEVVNDLFRSPITPACCRLGFLEMIATAVRKSSMGSIQPAVVQVLLDNINADFAAFRAIAVDEPRIVAATKLAIRHHLRTMDALHLACALSLGNPAETVVVSADQELLAAAENEGCSTLNPARGTERNR